MTERTTLADIRRAEEWVNEYLVPRGYEVHIGQRYGYKAVDIYQADGGLLDTLVSGITAREAYDILRGMERVLYLALEEKHHPPYD